MRPYWGFLLSAPLALVACGDDDSAGRLADAPPQADARIEPDTTVTLTVTYNGAPRAGIHTYFLAPDNTVIATVDTDAAGVASAKMPNGGSVTAIDAFPRILDVVRATSPNRAAAVEVGSNDLRTFVGVKGGDRLTLTNKVNQGANAYQIYAPRAEGSVSYYESYPSCGSASIYLGGGGSGSGSSDPGGYLYPSNCLNGKMDLIIIPFGYGADEQPHPLGVLVKTDIEFKEGEIIDLREETYATPTERTFSYDNSPGALQLSHSLVTSKAVFGPFSPSGSFQTETTLGEPTIAGATSIVDTRVETDTGYQHVIDAGAVTASYKLDFANLLLRGLTSPGAYDVAAKKLTWTESDTGAVPDFSIASFRVNHDTRNWDWTVVAPYTRGELVVPVLPTDVATWAPADGDEIYVSRVLNGKATGYDAVRARALDGYAAAFNQGYAGYALPSGRLVTVEYQSLGASRTAKTATPATKR